jgi:hypothetical protein
MIEPLGVVPWHTRCRSAGMFLDDEFVDRVLASVGE